MSLRPRRRDVLLGTLVLAGARRASAAPRAFTEDLVVDIHCHEFSASDLPMVGFVAHFIPGLTDFSREIWRWPERLVRTLLALVTKIPNAAVPDAATEGASLEAALTSNTHLQPVPDLPAADRQRLLASVLKYLPFGGKIGSDMRGLLDRYLDTIYLTSHARGSIAASLAQAYPKVALFTPCQVDFDRWSDDKAKTPLADQIKLQSQITRLSMKGLVGATGARFHSFVAFDPKREVELPSKLLVPTAPPAGGATAPDGGAGVSVQAAYCSAAAPATIDKNSGALDLVAYAIERAGFVGAKVYPPVGFAPLDNARLRRAEPDAARIDAALRGLYGYCQAREVPITTHASPGNEYGLGYRDLVQPLRWRPVLSAYPALRLNLGHFGHAYGIDETRGTSACEAWCYQASDLIQRYPNVYADVADTSAVNDEGYLVRYGGYLKDLFSKYPRLKKRLMYGTDWWLNRFEKGSENFPTAVPRLLDAAGLTAAEKANVMGRNALRFLGFLDDDNNVRDGLAAARLRAFYAANHATPPSWLA